ncbi:MAG: HXXEE domain-containing protein [Peptococcaceae bacterium]|nr:HXXEE domain-containing protein [Peptococcaceae bacterium]MBQ3119769.1 HXXEE domain-containing protein [Peptococcaceae bacterium]
MRFYRNNWYYIGGILFAFLAFILGLFSDFIDPMRRIMIVLFMCLLAHQFEEYAVPGGFPSAWNVGVSGETELGDRYPLNTKSAFIVNVCCAYPIYIAGIIFSQIHVLSIFIAYFTMAQIMMHGIMMNKKMGTLYNPGVGTALFVMVPIGIYSIWYIATNYTIPTWNWWAPILAFPFVAFLTILLPILKCQDKNSPYHFPERDTKGFSIKNKVARIRR